MKKTLVLCFIHGFQGGDDTFGDSYRFAQHLRDLVAERLDKINVRFLVYPKYETRGSLGDTVSRFRTWLEDKVIDMEVEAGTASPTVDPSVRTILVGHSMGGIVAAETAIALTSDQPVYSDADGIEKNDDPSSQHISSLMFPYIQGVLAFDTPFLGISPGVVAHGAEEHYQTAATAIAQLSSLWGATTAAKQTGGRSAGALPAPGTSGGGGGGGGGGGWGKWAKVAVGVGAAGAVAVGGAAAWLKRDDISQGFGWASSHLEFVGCLARGEELKKRVAIMDRLRREMDVGFANLYTRLGRAAPSVATSGSVSVTILGGDRTFCNLPKNLDGAAGVWKPAVNDKAKDETVAHMSMFEEKENPGYETLTRDARDFVIAWLQNDWYESSVDEA
ncbi:hypothetical protein GMORB2_2255 [Geosmithia morbida]|uniref:AB hydrolase-1 domain-containing protein n=1 Tax=Geosmithia morbida TaxID=1094350 RepID=A0A9P5CZ85_9HYPO|nr:uncharacterized protein GMORB2_2255 [Geosmithia morbida]KAF4121293.1 hypothetical protein GMORB2_2255 [Geosmithia morbida]